MICSFTIYNSMLLFFYRIYKVGQASLLCNSRTFFSIPKNNLTPINKLMGRRTCHSHAPGLAFPSPLCEKEMAFPYPPGEGRVGKMQETGSCQLGPCPWALTFKQENKRSKEAIIPSAKETIHPEWLGGKHPLQLGWDCPLLLRKQGSWGRTSQSHR